MDHLPFKKSSFFESQSETSYSPPSCASFTLHGALVERTFMPLLSSPILIWKLSKYTIGPSMAIGFFPPYSAGITGAGGGSGFSIFGGGGGLGILRTGAGGMKNALRPSKRSLSTLASCSCFFSEFARAAAGSASPPNVNKAISTLSPPLRARVPVRTTSTSVAASLGVQCTPFGGRNQAGICISQVLRSSRIYLV